MKVKIKKSTLDTYWYANKVGQEFEVKHLGSSDDFDFQVKRTNNYISRHDCVVIEYSQKELREIISNFGVRLAPNGST